MATGCLYFPMHHPIKCPSKVLWGLFVLKDLFVFVPSQLRWLPFSIPKPTEKKVDFVSVSQLTSFPRTPAQTQSEPPHLRASPVPSRVCTPSAAPETPDLATVSASTSTPATPPWPTGAFVCPGFQDGSVFTPYF